jgi:hypothetical protein
LTGSREQAAAGRRFSLPSTSPGEPHRLRNPPIPVDGSPPSTVREEGLRSGSVKPDDRPHRIIVQHLDVAVLVDAHRNAKLVCIGHIAPESEGVIFSVHTDKCMSSGFRCSGFSSLTNT